MTGSATGRFPGFDVLSQRDHWDPVTADLLTRRTGPPGVAEFFTPAEQACAAMLLNQLTGQVDQPLGIPVMEMVDARLAAGETDGWHYADLPEDGQAWRETLAWLDSDAIARAGTSFADLPEPDRMALIALVRDSQDWHGRPAARVWSLWTRYACTAFYSHPSAFSEMGFPGPAYPRGYKNPGVDKLEPFEVRDRRSAEDPVKDEG